MRRRRRKRISAILERLPILSERVNERFPRCVGDQVVLVHVFGMELHLSCMPAELIHVVSFG